ncbi:MAG: o-succinylbenzoate--CoA ligase [Chloroflexi bacterium]|nr:o-succinylbenzoate--CoA ligase [Chloroflexota bacterium]MDA1239626.1 o-succinylbenzoate--CoA ligase [Chloroflexota bacterium]MQC19288.1 o-succinylbenzoate--CoA ligase [Chloroflexota bacterium]
MTTAPLSVDFRDWVAFRAETHRDHLAIECGDERLNYADLDARVGRTAGALRALGVAEDEPLPVLAGNGVPIAVFAHAIPRAGALFMPLNARLSAGEIAYQLQDARVRFLIATPEYLDAARAAAEGAPGVQVLDATDARWEAGAYLAGPASVDPDTGHSVIYTSGTTGRPKGAVLTHGNFAWSAVASAANLGVQPDDRWLACMPLFHVGGLSILLRAAIYGTTAVIHDRFDEVRVNRALREERVTLLSVVAVMLQRMYEVDPLPYPRTLRAVLLGGGPAPRPLLEASRSRGVPVLQTYGLTETASQVATLAEADALRKLGSAGLPLPSATVRIEIDGRIAEPGEIGEIVVAGPTVCAGYLHRPDATAAAIRDGRLHTGDLGYVDTEGYLYIADRRDDLIVSGGENVYPAEVESALLEHPGVAECAVVGVPDERWGHRVVAVIVASAPEVTAEALEAHLRGRVAGYKVPRAFEFSVEPLPRTASGKLQRHLVRQALVERA